MLKLKYSVVTMILLVFFGSANASIITLTNQCSTGNAINGISVTDVTGNAGGASDCWGTFIGNDPGPNGSLTDGLTTWDFISKKDVGGNIEGGDISLALPINNGKDGTWQVQSGLALDSFIIVLKAANSPGWAAYLFDGADAASFNGSWSVAWNKDLSHLSFYGHSGSSELPEPFMFLLMGIGLVAIRVFSKDRLNIFKR